MWALPICSIQLLLWKRKWSTPKALFICFPYCSSFSKVTRSNHLHSPHTSTFQKKKKKRQEPRFDLLASLLLFVVTLLYFWTVAFKFETKNSSHPQSTVCVGGMFCTQNCVLMSLTPPTLFILQDNFLWRLARHMKQKLSSWLVVLIWGSSVKRVSWWLLVSHCK